MKITKKQVDRVVAQKVIDTIARVKELGKKNSITQTEAADRLGVSKQLISKWLTYPVSNLETETIAKLELAYEGDILQSRSFYEDEFINSPSTVLALNKAVLHNSDLSHEVKKEFHSELQAIVGNYQPVFTSWETWGTRLTGAITHFGLYENIGLHNTSWNVGLVEPDTITSMIKNLQGITITKREIDSTMVVKSKTESWAMAA